MRALGPNGYFLSGQRSAGSHERSSPGSQRRFLTRSVLPALGWTVNERRCVNIRHYYSVTFSSVHLSVLRVASSTATTARTSAQPVTPAGDVVTLSPVATAATTVTPASIKPEHLDSTAPGTALLSPAERQAEALLAALDADDDGSITEQEFTDGAKALLRRTESGRHRGREHSDHHGDHEDNGVRRHGRMLERLFDRVDADHDGEITKGELTTGLTRKGVTPDAAKATPPASPTDVDDGDHATAPATAAVVSFVSVTYTAVAVRSYSAVELLTSPPPERTPRLSAPLTA